MEASYGVPQDHPIGKDSLDRPRWKLDTRETGVTIPISN